MYSKKIYSIESIDIYILVSFAYSFLCMLYRLIFIGAFLHIKLVLRSSMFILRFSVFLYLYSMFICI